MAINMRSMKGLLRRFTPYYKWNAFGFEDTDEISNVIDYARGLVIKDADMAIELEDQKGESLEKVDKYIQASNGTLKDYSQYEIRRIIDNYNETNRYYIMLHDRFDIDYVTARTAKDYTVLKALNKTLDPKHEEFFYRAYNDSIDYYRKVISTPAFNNQQYNREFFQEYVIFMTVQRYITYTMEGFFDVDTYNKKMLKNAFISTGLDYFDTFSTEYQRRILKNANDLIRNKGTNRAFEIIRDIFSSNQVVISRLSLAKERTSMEDPIELKFIKTDIDKKINVENDPRLEYDAVTKDDPYWRIPKNTAIKQEFDIVNTKYLTVDIIMDVLTNSQSLGYLYTFLSRINKMNSDDIEELARTMGVLPAEAREYAKKNNSTIEDTSFNFIDKEISDQPINVFDAIIAIVNIIYQRDGYNESKKSSIVHRVYGFNFENPIVPGMDPIPGLTAIPQIDDVFDVIDSMRLYIEFLGNRAPEFSGTTEYEKAKEIFEKFNLRDFDGVDYNNISYEYIMTLYNSSDYYRDTILDFQAYIEKVNGSTRLKELMAKDDIYSALEFLNNEVLNESHGLDFEITNNEDSFTDINFPNGLEFSFFNKFEEFKTLWISFVKYQIADETFADNYYIHRMAIKYDSSVYDEFSAYVAGFNSNKLDRLYGIWDEEETDETLIALLNEIDEELKNMNANYNGALMLRNYPNLQFYMDVYLHASDFNKVQYSIADFTTLFEYNLMLRNELIELAVNTHNPQLYRSIQQILDKKFTLDSKKQFDNTVFEGYDSFADWLRDKDGALYAYSTISLPLGSDLSKWSKDDEIQKKVLQLVNDIDNTINMSGKEFLTDNNLIGIQDYIKRYVFILIQVFKAYTADTIQSRGVLDLSLGEVGKYDNLVKVMDDEIHTASMEEEDYFNMDDYIETRGTLVLSDSIAPSDDMFTKDPVNELLGNNQSSPAVPDEYERVAELIDKKSKTVLKEYQYITDEDNIHKEV